MSKEEFQEWREVIEMREEFFLLLKLMILLDKQTADDGDMELSLNHLLRVAFSQTEHLETSRVCIRHSGGNRFYVVGQFTSLQGAVMTTWIFEDNVLKEREEIKDDPEHPVHEFPCIVDIWNHNDGYQICHEVFLEFSENLPVQGEKLQSSFYTLVGMVLLDG